MDLNRILQGLSSSGAVTGFAGGLAGSALVGAVSGKKGRKMAKGALKVGALAAVGGLAYTAYQRYQKDKAPLQQAGATETPGRAWPQLTQEKFDAVVEDDAQGGALLLIRAMIAAAHSDGHIDAGEQDRVFAEAQRADLSAEEKAMLFDELRNPLSISALVAQSSNPETAIEVYAASVLAIDESRDEAKTYLRSLALALDLPAELTTSVHEQLATARQQSAA